MATHITVLDVELTRDQLIRILSQQLTMSWRNYPTSRDDCERRVKDYLLDLIQGNLKYLDRLEHQFEEKPKRLTGIEKFMEQTWSERRASGSSFADTAATIIDEYFPELKPKRKRKQG